MPTKKKPEADPPGAVLVDADRVEVWAKFMREASQNNVAFPISKTDLRAAINAADDWANTNASSYNSALPLPARTALSSQAKTLILVYILEQRWLKGA